MEAFSVSVYAVYAGLLFPICYHYFKWVHVLPLLKHFNSVGCVFLSFYRSFSELKPDFHKLEKELQELHKFLFRFRYSVIFQNIPNRRKWWLVLCNLLYPNNTLLYIMVFVSLVYRLAFGNTFASLLKENYCKLYNAVSLCYTTLRLYIDKVLEHHYCLQPVDYSQKLWHAQQKECNYYAQYNVQLWILFRHQKLITGFQSIYLGILSTQGILLTFLRRFHLPTGTKMNLTQCMERNITRTISDRHITNSMEDSLSWNVQRVKNFFAFYGNLRSIILFTRRRRWSLFWAIWVHSTL